MKIIEKDKSPAAVRAFAILEQVVKSEDPVSLDELASACRLPKPTVHRILALLGKAGILQREPDNKRYTIGARLSRLAVDVLMNSPLRAARRGILQRLVDEIGETCNVTALDGNEVLYLDRVEASWPVRLHMQPGSRVPLHCTASGKLFLSQLPRRQRQRLLGNGPLKRYTENTITDRRRLERELEAIRAAGVATDNEEFLPGSICVAVPIRDESGRMYAAIAMHGPAPRMSLEKGLQSLPALRRAAEALAATYFPPASRPTAPRRKKSVAEIG